MKDMFLLKRSLWILIVFSVLGLGSLGCSTARKADSEGQFERRLSYTVEAVSENSDSVIGKSFYFLSENKDLYDMRDIYFSKRALLAEGMLEAESAETADLIIAVSFSQKRPKLGIPVGILNPYRHEIQLLAKSGDHVKWQLNVGGPSEKANRAYVVPRLLAAAHGYFGKVTLGSVTVQMRDNDPKVIALLGDKEEMPGFEDADE